MTLQTPFGLGERSDPIFSDPRQRAKHDASVAAAKNAVDGDSRKAIAGVVNGKVAAFMYTELTECQKHDKLLATAAGTATNSQEYRVYMAFLKERAIRLGYDDSLESIQKAGHFAVKGNGQIKLMLNGSDAKLLMEILETGKIPGCPPLDMAAWLASKPAEIANLHDLERISKTKEGGSIDENCLYVAERDLRSLPKFVRPIQKQGYFCLTDRGYGMIPVGPAVAREALDLSKGFKLRAEVSNTVFLLLRNIEVILPDGGKTPKDVIADISDRNRRIATPVFVDPGKLINAIDRHADPKAMGKAFAGAVMESAALGLARATAVHYAREAERRSVVVPSRSGMGR